MDNLVLLKTYHNKYDAETAVGLLKSNGIEAILSSDISLGDNQILVKKEDLGKAREAIKPLEESLSDEEVKQIEEAAIEAKEAPAKEKGRKTDFTIAIPFVIAAIFLCSYIFQETHKQKYYAGGLDCKRLNPDSIYTACKEYYKNQKVRTIVISKKNKGDGPVKEFFESGILRREWAYVDGKLDGLFKEYYANGQLKVKVSFKNDKKEGESKEYYETGELKRIANFKDDLFDGPYKAFYKSGELAQDIELKKGVRSDAEGLPYNGIEKTYHENGAMWEVLNYKEGKLEGLNKSYYENGNLESEGNYRNGRLEGEAKAYYPNGNFQFVSQHKRDVPIAVKEYDQEGNMIFQSVYE